MVEETYVRNLFQQRWLSRFNVEIQNSNESVINTYHIADRKELGFLLTWRRNLITKWKPSPDFLVVKTILMLAEWVTL